VPFSVFHFPGELKTQQPLDREEEEEYHLTVRALDGGGRYCEAAVHLTVGDVNDNAPQFTSDPYAITVFENTEVGTFVARLLATDLDTGTFVCLFTNELISFVSCSYLTSL
jgi:protocadherin Fat 1/2/3